MFDNEEIDKSVLTEVVRRVTENIKSKLVIMVKDMHEFRNQKPSQLAAAIVYLARKEEYN
jgi:hypothetical protein